MSIDILEYAAGVCEEFALGAVKIEKELAQIGVVVENKFVPTLMAAMARLEFRRVQAPSNLGEATALIFQRLELSSV